jgi:RNA recognition motif-containing protein
VSVSRNAGVYSLFNHFSCAFLCHSVVEFASAEDMKKAISTLNDTELSGRRIRLVEERQQSGGRRRRLVLHCYSTGFFSFYVERACRS